MLRILKLVIRSLERKKRLLIFSIVSLAISLSLVVLTSGYYAYETSCDKYQSKYKRIYRLVNTPKKQIRLDDQYYNKLITSVSGIDKVCRINIFSSMVTSDKGVVQNISNLIIADSTFFDLFDYKILMGPKQYLLDSPNKIVLSKSLAIKLFGHEDPLGKPVKINMITTAFVSGVFDDLQEKSHFNSDAVISLYTDNLPHSGGTFGNQRGKWKVKLFSYYLLLNEKVDTASVAPQIKLSYIYPWYSFTPNIAMQPLSDIFTNSDFRDERTNHLNRHMMWLLFSITLILIIIAAINYINLSLSNLNAESKLVSILKVNGAHRNNVFRYYAASAGLITLISLDLAIVLSITFLPCFNQLIGSEIHLDILTNISYLIPFCGVLLILFLAIGLYPAWMFSGINPVNLFQGKIAGRIRLSSFSKVMLVAQYTAAMVLVASVLMIFKQINYMKNKNPGFETSYLVKQNIHYSVKSTQIIKTYAGELRRNPNILKQTLSDGIPLDIHSYSNQEINGQDVRYKHIDCDTAFFNTLKMKLVAGRSFFDTDHRDVCIITEKLARDCGFDNPLNEKIGNVQIIGIIADFNSMSMHQQLDGVMFRPLDNYISNITFRINGTNIPQTISYIEKAWKTFFPEYPFNYEFYDGLIARQYEKEQKLADSISIIAILAVFLCCLGLLGLVMNMVDNRVKEIGIRKVNGAKISEILAMLNQDFVKLVAIAFIIACPIAYYSMNRWLENFAYRASISWWIFAFAGVLALGITLLTVTWQSWKTASMNPVEALRYE